MKLAKQILAVGLTAVLLAAALPSCTPTGTAELTIDPAARHQTLESLRHKQRMVEPGCGRLDGQRTQTACQCARR